MKTIERVCRSLLIALLVLGLCISPALARTGDEDQFSKKEPASFCNNKSVIDGWSKTMLASLYSYVNCLDKAVFLLQPEEITARQCSDREELDEIAEPDASSPGIENNDNAPYPDVPAIPHDEAQSGEPAITEEPGTTDHNNEPALSEDYYIAEVIRLVNIERNAAGLSPLTESTVLDQAASVRCGEIMTVFSHTRPDGSSCFTALQEAGARYGRAGENIAIGQSSPSQVVQAWMDSPGHRANIMNEGFRYIGVSARPSNNGYGGYAWVQVFTD